MAVVTGQSDLFRNPHDDDQVVDPSRTRGRRDHQVGTVANAATDSATSMYKLAQLPSDCLLHPSTFFTLTNWGFANINIGTKTDATALGTVARSATSWHPVAEGDANHGKELWEVLGLAEDPGGWIELYVHGPANATAAGSMPFMIETIRVT